MAAFRCAQILTKDWQGHRARDRSPCQTPGERGGSSQPHVAAQMTLYLHYPQREAAERCKCQAGAKPHVSQKSMSAGTCALLKKTLDFIVFQTMLWPDCYLQPESAW